MNKTEYKYEYEKIFHMYTKYRLATFYNIMSYDNQIFKFKEKIHSFNKTLKEMERSLLPKKNDEPVLIFIKEDKKIKKYEEQPRSDQDEPQNNSSNSEENEEEKEMKKIKSEPKIEIKENNNENDNNNNINEQIIKKDKEKRYYFIGSFPDFVDALKKRGWNECSGCHCRASVQ